MTLIDNARKAIEALKQHLDDQQIIRVGVLEEPETARTYALTIIDKM